MSENKRKIKKCEREDEAQLFESSDNKQIFRIDIESGQAELKLRTSKLQEELKAWEESKKVRRETLALQFSI